MAAANLPWEITIDILSFLPVKSLIRFKCVSKSFYSLISRDSHFKRKHQNQSESKRAILYLQDEQESICSRAIYPEDEQESFCSCSLSTLSSDDRQDVIKHDLPFKGPWRIHSSCDGLFCITYIQEVVFIWNPSTRELNRLPDCPIVSPSLCIDESTYGLAYDSISHDYKVLKVIGPELIFYSLKNDSWRRVEDTQYKTACSWDDCNLVNGAFHWISSLRKETFHGPFVIVSLEINSEKYKVSELPPSVPRLAYETLFRLTVLGGKLCLYSHFFRISFDLWVMEEYGNTKSWTKKLSIPYSMNEWRNPENDLHLYLCWKPLYLFEDGKILLDTSISEGQRVLIYNEGRLVSKTIANRKIERAHIWTETLTSPHLNGHGF